MLYPPWQSLPQLSRPCHRHLSTDMYLLQVLLEKTAASTMAKPGSSLVRSRHSAKTNANAKARAPPPSRWDQNGNLDVGTCSLRWRCNVLSDRRQRAIGSHHPASHHSSKRVWHDHLIEPCPKPLSKELHDADQVLQVAQPAFVSHYGRLPHWENIHNANTVLFSHAYGHEL